MKLIKAQRLIDEAGKMIYESSYALTHTTLHYVKVVNEEAERLFYAPPIYQHGIEEICERRPLVPTILFSQQDPLDKLPIQLITNRHVELEFHGVEDTKDIRAVIQRWMSELPQFKPLSILCSVYLTTQTWRFDEQYKFWKFWKYNNEQKRYESI